MTPAGAASILEVPPTATPQEIEAAYRRRSRASHPDRFAGQPASVTSAAAAEFVRITEARELLLRTAAQRSGEPSSPIAPPYEGYEVTTRRRRSWFAVGIWTALLVAALVVSVLDDSDALSGFDITLRLIPLAIVSVAFAVTGRRVWFVLMIALVAVSAAITIAIASFGPLLSLELLLVPLLGLGYLGLQQMRRRAR